MSDKHEEKAKGWLLAHMPRSWGWISDDPTVKALAEQFREVEREAVEEPSRVAAERVGADPEVRAVLLREFGTTEPELISETVAQLRASVGEETKRCHRMTVERLREVVHAGDALRKYAEVCQDMAGKIDHLCDDPKPLALILSELSAWDAATKGIARD